MDFLEEQLKQLAEEMYRTGYKDSLNSLLEYLNNLADGLDEQKKDGASIPLRVVIKRLTEKKNNLI